MRMIMCTLTAAALIGCAGVATAHAQGDMQARAAAYSKLMNTTLPEVSFKDNELRNVISFLSQMGDVDILAKWNEGNAFGGGGLDPHAKITLELKNPTSLVTVLELVLRQATDDPTTWCLGDGYVEVGTKEQLNKKKYLRIYPVRELLFVPPRFDNAPELDLQNILQQSGQQQGGGGSSSTGNLFKDDQSTSQDNANRVKESDEAKELQDIITTIVEPTQWESAGGEGGSIRYFRGNLLINAADYMHREVGGYPFSASHTNAANNRQASMTSTVIGPRYVSLSGDFGMSQVVGFGEVSVPVLVNGQVFTSNPGH